MYSPLVWISVRHFRLRGRVGSPATSPRSLLSHPLRCVTALLCLAATALVAHAQSVVTVIAIDAVAVIDPADHAKVRFTRTGSTTNALTVYYQRGGNASAWDDYRLLNDTMPDNVTFPASA